MLKKPLQRCLALASVLPLVGACWFHQCAPDDSFENTIHFVNDHCAHGAALGNYIYLGPQQTVHLGTILFRTTHDGYVSDADLSNIAKEQYPSMAAESTAPITCDVTEEKGWKIAVGADAVFKVANVTASLTDNQLTDGAVSFNAIYLDVLNNVATAEDLVVNWATKSPHFAKDLKSGVFFATSILRVDGLAARFVFKNELTSGEQAKIKAKEFTVDPTIQVAFTDTRTLVLKTSGQLRVAAGGIDLQASPSDFANLTLTLNPPIAAQHRYKNYYIRSVKTRAEKTAHLVVPAMHASH